MIDFDNLPANTAVTNQYPQTVFSTEAGGYFTKTFQFNGLDGSSAPNVLGVAIGPGAANLRNLYVDFTSPVSGLTFLAVAANEYGVVARVHVYSGANLLGTDNIIGNAPLPNTLGLGSFLVNLTAYPNVTRIEVVPPIGLTEIDGNQSPNGGGLVYDNFDWDIVPEPATAGLLALGGLAAAFRRRRG